MSIGCVGRSSSGRLGNALIKPLSSKESKNTTASIAAMGTTAVMMPHRAGWWRENERKREGSERGATINAGWRRAGNRQGERGGDGRERRRRCTLNNTHDML